MALLKLWTLSLILAVIFVNGWTDAPGAITGVVASRVLPYQKAVALAAVMNLLGVLAMTGLCPAVADTIYGMVNFAAMDSRHSLAALAGAMTSIVLFAVAAWWFGIPTSESHALVAGTLGAAYALNRQAGVSLMGLVPVLLGLGISLLLGYFLGKGVQRLFSPVESRLGKGFYRMGEIFFAGMMAFCHGAQDGQKFAAVFLLADGISRGLPSSRMDLSKSWQVVALTALVMALGTYTGGERIIRKVGQEMVPLDRKTALYSDMAGSVCLLFTTLWGLPVSTTHTKTAAVAGVGGDSANRGIMAQMTAVWLLTFPVCAVLGYGCTKLFLRFL